MSDLMVRPQEGVEISPTQLITAERIALSWAFHHKHPESLYDEFRDGPGYNTPDGAPPQVAERVARLLEAQSSLARFGLLEQFHLTRYRCAINGREDEWVEAEDQHDPWPGRGYRAVLPGRGYRAVLYHPGGRVETLESERVDAVMRSRSFKYDGWGYGAGWNYRLTERGREALAALNPRIYKCCDGAVVIPCVCTESTSCAEHGGGCHGSHD